MLGLEQHPPSDENGLEEVTQMDIRPGDTVYGDTKESTYEIVRLIGVGQFGIVYEITDGDGNRFALKTIITAGLDATDMKALVNEGRLATEIDHPNAIHVVYFHDGDQYPELPPYMVLEFADGGTLQDILNERRDSGTLFDSDELRAMCIQLASGMKAVNEKLVHRDIKPDNILLVEGILKIADFGLAKMVGAATRTSTFKGVNHIRYCAPEAWEQSHNTPAMDMYSMGIVFYEMATLHHPYSVTTSGDVIGAWKTAHLSEHVKSPRDHDPTLALALAQVILKMLDKRPERRFASWGEVIERIEQPGERTDYGPDVSALVKKTVDRHQEEERERLEAERGRLKQQRIEQRVEYAFSDVHSAAENIVDEFNRSSDFAKLQIQRNSGMSFSITSDRNIGGMVNVFVRVQTDDYQFYQERILAWGHASADSGRGFNLLLIQKSSDDLYGEWATLHVIHNSLVIRNDGRPEPFPFRLDELPGELELIGATHIYNVEKDIFQQGMLMPLIDELL